MTLRRPKQVRTEDEQFVDDYCDYSNVFNALTRVLSETAREFSEYDVKALVNKSEKDSEIADLYKAALEKIDIALDALSQVCEPMRSRISEKAQKKYSKGPGFFGN